MVGFVFFTIFAILGFLILTKNSREAGSTQANSSDLENKVDVVDLAEQDSQKDKELALDETQDTVIEEPQEEPAQTFPDLIVSNYKNSDEPRQNEEMTVSFDIENIGDKDTGKFKWEWYSNDDEVGCDDDVSWLDAGDKESVECNFTYEYFGNFNTKVVVDVDDEVTESNEDNNSKEKEIDVAEEEYVDLTITEYSFDPVPEMGVPFQVRIGIKNNGNVKAENFYWEWWPAWANYACREKIATLAAHSEKVVTCDYTYAGWSTYDTKAVADADNNIEESDEDNNEYHEDVVPIH